jgi:predicted nuclease of predicted toxin-antitoxin system
VRFLVDECAGPFLAAWLSKRGHDVFSVFASARGAEDDWILNKACSDKRILVTNDKGFGEKIFRSGAPHSGVVLLRLANETPSAKAAVFERLLSSFSDRLEGAYIVVSERKVRIVER